MIIGVLVIEILIYSSTSLKEKRFVIKSIKDRIINKFNVSIAELRYQDKWQRSEIGIAVIGNQQSYVEHVLQKIFQSLDHSDQYEIISYNFEYI